MFKKLKGVLFGDPRAQRGTEGRHSGDAGAAG